MRSNAVPCQVVEPPHDGYKMMSRAAVKWILALCSAKRHKGRVGVLFHART